MLWLKRGLFTNLNNRKKVHHIAIKKVERNVRS